MLLATQKKKMLQGIFGKQLMNREKSANIQKSFNLEDINESITRRKQEQADHITRIVSIAMEKS